MWSRSRRVTLSLPTEISTRCSPRSTRTSIPTRRPICSPASNFPVATSPSPRGPNRRHPAWALALRNLGEQDELSDIRRVIAAGMIGNVLEWVRFCDLRLFRSTDWSLLLPARRCGRPAAFGIRRVRDRLSDAACRRRVGRPYRRQVRSPHSTQLLCNRDGNPDLSDGLVAGLSDIGVARAYRAHFAVSCAGTFGGRRIYKLDGVPGRACTCGTP